MGFQYKVRLLSLPANIRLGYKGLTETNTVANYNIELVMTVILFSTSLSVLVTNLFGTLLTLWCNKLGCSTVTNLFSLVSYEILPFHMHRKTLG
jgi:hypothetical protein